MRSLSAFLAALLLTWSLVQATTPMTERIVESSTKVTTIQIPIVPPIVHAHVVEVVAGNVQTTDNANVVMPTKATKIMEPMSSTREIMESTQDPCDWECTKMDFNPICATNGRCQHEFPNECIMVAFNCRHPSIKFTMVAAEPCDDNGDHHQNHPHEHHQQPHHHSRLERCTPEDLMDFMSAH